MLFLSSKASKKSSQWNLKVGEEIVRNQDEVAETLAGYFATTADDIGRENVDSLTESDFTNHPSVLKIAQHSIQYEALAFKPIQKAEVQQVKQTLKVRKASGYDAIPTFVLRVGAAESLPHLPNY